MTPLILSMIMAAFSPSERLEIQAPVTTPPIVLNHADEAHSFDDVVSPIANLNPPENENDSEQSVPDLCLACGRG